MMMSNIEREEMLDYLRILSGLNSNGFRCEKEIREVLEIVHEKEFGFDGKIQASFRRLELNKLLQEQVFNSRLKDGIANQGKLIRVTEADRQVGKTTLLIGLSLDFNIPILVGHSGLVEHAKELAVKEFGARGENLSVMVGKYHEVMGRKFPNGILVDCSVRYEDYKEIRKYKHIRGGFHHDRDFI
ncbi:hypothetical protein X915_gp243 [Bacillus phage vB_BanS-Tsamsa]|uniref:Uncharacterized protein n=1 Tax=Bacillus phage vB_BanS-Tsamsa TaxID=1308863 RepID=U5J9P3_9CAUD|nr:hypothetical protein X915_gp243 [Bacillus phage vB_BanS-Tsamsa]AGI11796.1 hypothetical protein [Bacillus phage vB_BanS-Tsamsa]